MKSVEASKRRFFAAVAGEKASFFPSHQERADSFRCVCLAAKSLAKEGPRDRTSSIDSTPINQTQERNKHMKRPMFKLLLAILLWLGSSLIARGDPPLGCCDVIQFATSQLEDCNTTGEFQTVVVSPLEMISATLQFGVSLARTPVVIQALDGGTLGINGSATIDQDGNVTFPFQIDDQRCSLHSAISMLRRRSAAITLPASPGHSMARSRLVAHMMLTQGMPQGHARI
jgi:hypothetical protein